MRLTLKFFALLDLVALVFLGMQLSGIFSSLSQVPDTAVTHFKILGMVSVFFTLLFSAGGQFFAKKFGLIVYYFQFPLRLQLWIFSFGFITLLPEAFSYYGDFWPDWLFRLCVMGEFFRLYFTIRFHRRLNSQ